MARHSNHFVVLGLGVFGSTLARRLTDNGCRVSGLDSSHERVEALKNVLFEAMIGDATDRDTMSQLAVDTCDGVIISLGGSMVPSLLATLHAKEQNAGRIIVKGVDDDHGRILKQLGVDRVIYPKVDVAEQLGDQLTWPNILDYIPIDPDYGFVEIAVPTSWNGKSLIEIDLRRKYGVWVFGMKDVLTGERTMFPDADVVLSDDRMLLVVGRRSDLDQLDELT